MPWGSLELQSQGGVDTKNHLPFFFQYIEFMFWNDILDIY